MHGNYQWGVKGAEERVESFGGAVWFFVCIAEPLQGRDATVEENKYISYIYSTRAKGQSSSTN